MTPLLLFVASLIAAFSIPTDIKQQTIHTILTKPVERFEIILGRFLGYTLLMTLVLFFMTASASVTWPAASRRKRPMRASRHGCRSTATCSFRGHRRARERASNVGKEWDYRSYISGKMSGEQGGQVMPTQYAIWSFHEARKPRQPQQGTLRVQLRHLPHHQGPRRTRASSAPSPSRRARWDGNRLAWKKERDALLEAEKLKPEPKTEWQIDDQLAEKYGYYEVPSKEVVNNHTIYVDVPPGLFKNAAQAAAGPLLKGQQASSETAPLRVRVQCISDTQFLGMAKYDLLLAAGRSRFGRGELAVRAELLQGRGRPVVPALPGHRRGGRAEHLPDAASSAG